MGLAIFAGAAFFVGIVLLILLKPLIGLPITIIVGAYFFGWAISRDQDNYRSLK
jgi:Flp pilus assembly protein TadB